VLVESLRYCAVLFGGVDDQAHLTRQPHLSSSKTSSHPHPRITLSKSGVVNVNTLIFTTLQPSHLAARVYLSYRAIHRAQSAFKTMPSSPWAIHYRYSAMKHQGVNRERKVVAAGQRTHRTQKHCTSPALSPQIQTLSSLPPAGASRVQRGI
jgi:hypothetical protein